MKSEDLLHQPVGEDIHQIIEHVMDEADKRYRARGFRGIDGSINDQELRLVLEVLLETIHAEINRRLPVLRAAVPNVAGHNPIMTLDMTRITGCTCGWQIPMGTTDSDEALAMHVAIVRAGGQP